MYAESDSESIRSRGSFDMCAILPTFCKREKTRNHVVARPHRFCLRLESSRPDGRVHPGVCHLCCHRALPWGGNIRRVCRIPERSPAAQRARLVRAGDFNCQQFPPGFGVAIGGAGSGADTPPAAHPGRGHRICGRRHHRCLFLWRRPRCTPAGSGRVPAGSVSPVPLPQSDQLFRFDPHLGAEHKKNRSHCPLGAES